MTTIGKCSFPVRDVCDCSYWQVENSFVNSKCVCCELTTVRHTPWEGAGLAKNNPGIKENMYLKNKDVDVVII